MNNLKTMMDDYMNVRENELSGISIHDKKSEVHIDENNYIIYTTHWIADRVYSFRITFEGKTNTVVESNGNINPECIENLSTDREDFFDMIKNKGTIQRYGKIFFDKYEIDRRRLI